MTDPATEQFVRHDEATVMWASGLAMFAGVLLTVLGFLQVLQGVSAVANDELYVTTVSYVFRFDLTVWGWIHLVCGTVAIVVGVLILMGRKVGFVVGIVVAAVSVLSNFLFLPQYPLWSLVLIALDIAVIWALSVLMGR